MTERQKSDEPGCLKAVFGGLFGFFVGLPLLGMAVIVILSVITWLIEGAGIVLRALIIAAAVPVAALLVSLIAALLTDLTAPLRRYVSHRRAVRRSLKQCPLLPVRVHEGSVARLCDGDGERTASDRPPSDDPISGCVCWPACVA